MAYFCYEVFAKRLGEDAKDSATKHKISHKLVKRVSNLASNKGGGQARHHSAICHPLTQPEVQFLEKAVVAMISRAAMVAADSNQPMDTIDGSNLLQSFAVTNLRAPGGGLRCSSTFGCPACAW